MWEGPRDAARKCERARKYGRPARNRATGVPGARASMSVRPSTFFAFAAARSELLTALFRHHVDGVGHAELVALIERHAGDDDPSVEYQLEQLERLRILEPSPAGDAVWQLTFPVQQLLGFLLRHQTLTGAAVLQAYVAEMGTLAGDLEQASARGEAEGAVRALGDLQAPLERLRNDSANNRDRLTTEALDIKANAERTSARVRFERINHLWHRYLIPLRDVLDTNAAMDATLDRLGLALDHARLAFAARTSVDQGLVRAKRTLLRLRRAVFADHEESVREIEPLYRQLRRDTRLSRGASRALERLRADGWSGLPVEGWLGLPKRERSPRFSDSALEAFLHGLRGYSPARPDPWSEHVDVEPPARIDRAELVDAMEASAPIDDVLAWLIEQYGDQGAAQILRAYGWIHAGELGPVFEDAVRPRDYELPGFQLRSRPLGLQRVVA